MSLVRCKVQASEKTQVVTENEQIRILLERQNRFSLNIEQRFRNMSSKPIMIEEVSKN